MGKPVKDKSFFDTAKIYLKFSLKYKPFLAVFIVLLPVVVVSGQVLLPLIYAGAIDQVQELVGSQKNLWETFGKLIWQSVGLVILIWISWRIIGFTLATFEFRVKRDLEQHIFRHLTTHSYSFHTNSFSGSLVAQTNRMTNSFERLFDVLLFNFGRMSILIISTLIVLYSKSVIVATIILFWIITYTSLMAILQYKKLPFAKAAAEQDSKVTGILADSLTNIFAIITFGHKRIERKRFNNASQKKYKVALKDWYLSEAIFAIQTFLIMSVEALIIWITISLALQGQFSVGDIVLVQFYVIAVLGYLWEFGRALRNVERSFADAHEMTQILNQSETVKDPLEPEETKITNGKIEFKNVSFSYDKSDKLFKNFNLNISAGQRVGLVGASGGGKTTITKLLLRLMDTNGGKIMIDGQDISRLAQDDLRKHIAYVPQEPILFHRSIADNIRYGSPESSNKNIIEAAQKARADEFINNLKDKYDTLVGERGIKLSGGQKQRVAIARAMLKSSPILLLDEATSALDSESEQAIQKALLQLMEGRTAIVIAHRLSTIQKMDRIIVIEEGKIKEDGTHQALLKKNGNYAKLWKHQSGGFIKD